MGKELFTIGEIAELFSVNIRTLRYYDQYGILKPEKTDPATGYRYYSTRQFERLNTIKYLRALDMPLSRIALFFENRDTDVLRRLLEEQRQETRERLRELAQIEKKLGNRLAQLDRAEFGALERVEKIAFPRRRIVRLQRDIRPEDDLEYPIRELEKRHKLEPMIFLGKVGLSISRENLLAGRFDRYDGIFAFVESEDGPCAGEKGLEAGDYVTIRFSGTHRGSACYYEKLMRYLEEEGLACAGDSVEVTLIDAGFTNDTSKYVTELQIPVQA